MYVYLAIEPDGIEDEYGGGSHGWQGGRYNQFSAYGYIVDKILIFSYVKPEAAGPGQHFLVMIAAQPRHAVVMDGPIYDPMNRRACDGT